MCFLILCTDNFRDSLSDYNSLIPEVFSREVASDLREGLDKTSLMFEDVLSSMDEF